METMKKSVLHAVYVLSGLAVFAVLAVLADCENPWMKNLTSSLYGDEDETPPVVLTGITAIEAWINAAIAANPSAGSSAANPIHLPPVALSLAEDPDGNGFTERGDLLSLLAGKGRYVDLNLSACGMTGISPPKFDPGTANTGEQYITALTLPTEATSVAAGTPSGPTFRYFTALKSVSGAGVTDIGNHAFRSCTALTTVNFPAAQIIGVQAFFGCNNVTSITLGAVPPTTVGTGLFMNTSPGIIAVTIPTGSLSAYTAWEVTYRSNFSPKVLSFVEL
jgi:hypothetical protein